MGIYYAPVLMTPAATLTGVCNDKVNITIEVNSTNFASVMYQSKEAPEKSTQFFHNTCEPTNRRRVGALMVQCTTSGQPDHQQFDANIWCSFTVNRTTAGAEIIVASAGATTHVNISLDSKLMEAEIFNCVLNAVSSGY